jgi:hypothetical protein
VDGVFLKAVSADGDRPDVAGVHPATGPAHGIDATVALPTGRHTVCAFAINVLGAQGNPLLSCLQTDVAGSPVPIGTLDDVSTTAGVTAISGWTFDGDVPASPLAVHYYLDGRFLGLGPADTARIDVAGAYPGVGPAHGYTGYFVLPAGVHDVCTFAINQGAPGVNPLLGCRRVTVP